MPNDAPPRLPSAETNSFSLSKSTNQSTYWQYVVMFQHISVYEWFMIGIKEGFNCLGTPVKQIR
jgi:hypothetical protein